MQNSFQHCTLNPGILKTDTIEIIISPENKNGWEKTTAAETQSPIETDSPLAFFLFFNFLSRKISVDEDLFFPEKQQQDFKLKKKKWKMKKKNATYAFHVPFFQQFYIIVEWTLFKLSCIGQVSYINGHQHFGVLCGHDSVLIWLLVLVSTGIYLSTRNKQHYNIPISDKQPSQTTKRLCQHFYELILFRRPLTLALWRAS